MSQRNDKFRPAVLPPEIEIQFRLEEILTEDFIEAIRYRQNQPITKTTKELYDYFNVCVDDPDFRHPQSGALRECLRIVRDILCDANEKWIPDDALEPIMVQVRRIVAENQAAPMIKYQRDDSTKLQERNEQIVLRVEALKKAGVSSVMKIVAKEFNREEKTIRNICSKYKKSIKTNP